VPINHIYSYLVHPKKGSTTASQINGTSVPLTGKLFDLLQKIYANAETECDIDITFSSNAGAQQNDCRDLICKYLARSSLANGRLIAQRLESNTDGRSGLGLLFLISGTEGGDHKIIISRFPTDNAIYVDDDPQNLTIQFLERVFMKNKASYKAVVYRHASPQASLWNGRAIDKQLNSPAGELSTYWIVDFLASEFTVTAARGTQRLASAIRNAVKKSDIVLKQELISAANLARGLAGQRTSIQDFGNRFSLSPEARAAIAGELKNSRMVQERFQFDLTEFQTIVAFKSVELSNGATLTAASDAFDDVFNQVVIDARAHEMRFTTEGKVVNEKLKSKA